jgi:hypothetical protein
MDHAKKHGLTSTLNVNMTELLETTAPIVFPGAQKSTGDVRREPPTVRWNGGRPTNPSDIGWLRETTKDTPLAEMRRRYDEDGYILIKRLIPREAVLSMRDQ